MFDLGEVSNRVSSTFQALPSFKGPDMGQFNVGLGPVQFNNTTPGANMGGMPVPGVGRSPYASSSPIPGSAIFGGLGSLTGLGDLNFGRLGLGPIAFNGPANPANGLQLNTDGSTFTPPPPTSPSTDSNGGSTFGGPYNPSDVEAYIRHKAASLKIDPDIAAKVAGGEGLHTYVGDHNSSFGPFQLHYSGMAQGPNAAGGLGDLFTQETGLHASDQSTWKDQVDWVLNGLSKGRFDWTPWHGAAAQGIVGKMGLGTYSGAVPDYVPSAQPKTDWEQTAESQLASITGKPYHWGGADPVTGFDCSGFTQWVFKNAFGINLLHGTTYQYAASQPTHDPQKGDLVFFNMNINDPHMQHVGIYLGNGQFIHDTDFGGQNGVQIGNVADWANQHPEFRRVG